MEISIDFGGGRKKHRKNRKHRRRNRSRSNSRDRDMAFHNAHMGGMGMQHPPPQMGGMAMQHPPPQGGMGMHPPPPQMGMQQQNFQHGGYTQPGQPPAPPSQHYGNCSGQMQQNVFSINAAQAVGYNSEAELQQMYNAHYNQRLQGIQAAELMNILNKTQGIQRAFRIHFGPELCKIMLAMLDVQIVAQQTLKHRCIWTRRSLDQMRPWSYLAVKGT